MQFASLTAPLRKFSQAVSPNNVANSLVEGGYRVGGPAGATIAGGVAAIAGGAATYAVATKLNAIETARNIGQDFATAQSAGSKLGAILGGAAELAVDIAAPVMMGAFVFESLDAMAQAWDKPQNKINLDK